MPENSFTQKLAGATLIAGTALALALMTHHPTLGSPGHAGLADELNAEAGLNRFVHGAMIVILFAFQFGGAMLSRRLGEDNAAASSAGFLFATAIVAMTGAALASGFVSPLLAQRLSEPSEQEMLRTALTVAAALNQTLAPFSVIAFGVAIFLWSIVLAKRNGAARLIGVAGLIIGAALMTTIAAGYLELDLPGMSLALLGFGGWLSLAGAAMIRGAL